MSNKNKKTTPSHKSSIRSLEVLAQEREDARIATLNLLEDLTTEKSKVEMSRAREEAILLSIGDGLVVTDETGSIILMNQMAEILLGKLGQESIGKSYSEVFIMEDEKGGIIPLEKHPISLALSTGTTTTTTTTSGPSYYFVRKDKTRFPTAITVAPVIFNGKLIGAIKVFRDITEEKEIDKAKTEFVSLASHQLRTPLTAISWYTEMILKGDVGQVPVEQRKYLEEIYHGNVRMIELVNTLLDVSRIDLGTLAIERKDTDIVVLAHSVLEEQKPRIENKKLIIKENFGRDLPLLLTDPKLLRVVLQNLLSNSVDYTPDGGSIEFAISLKDPSLPGAAKGQSKKNILIEVSDTGYGIPKNQQNKIFTKLFRADNAREIDTDGTGLGLYIVKSIVENDGGKIWFKSEQNKGTTFYVEYPVSLKKEESVKA